MPASNSVVYTDLPYGQYTIEYTDNGTAKSETFNFTPSNEVFKIQSSTSGTTDSGNHKYSNLTLDLRAGARVTIRKDNTDVPDTVIDDFIMPGSVDTANWERTSRYELKGIEYGDYKITFTTCDSGTKITRTFPLKIKNPETAVSYRYSKTDNTTHSYNVMPES